MSKYTVGILMFLGFWGIQNFCWAVYESKEALYEKLRQRGFQYVVETANRTVHSGDYTAKKEVIDLSTGSKLEYSFERLPAMDFKVKTNPLRQYLFDDLVAQAYNVSNVMVCYFLENTNTYKGREVCLMFPYPVNEVVKAISE